MAVAMQVNEREIAHINPRARGRSVWEARRSVGILAGLLAVGNRGPNEGINGWEGVGHRVIMQATRRRVPAGTTGGPFQIARCTCPILAAAAGLSLNSRKYDRQSGPSCSARTLCTLATGSGGADSCSFVSACRYGAAISSGSAASNTESAWPNFIAPPLSCAQHTEQLFGRTLLDFGRDHLRGEAGDPLTDAEHGPTGEAERQGG